MSLISLFRRKIRKTLFTTPSHNQRFFIFNKFRQFYKYDISETDAHNPQEALETAQERARKIYGVKYTCFLTNGSTSGIIAAVLACTKRCGRALIWDKAHPSHLNAVKLAGCEPVYYETGNAEGRDITGAVSNNVIAEAFRKFNDIKAVIVTSPTYEGIVSDIRGIKKLCEKHGAYLIADEAHGALYPFSDELPESSVKIADFTIQSLHKTAGGLNPTALLHSNCDINPRSALETITTTSPSYPLLASIEANINFLNSRRGRRHISELIKNINNLKNECQNTEFYKNDDPSKILIKTSVDLYGLHGIEEEKSSGEWKLFLCGIGTSLKKINRLKRAIKQL
ncbi:MAG: aminotransferase class I/II-fold pyridoxal phosphate-dependent enzyme [Heliobacteriaceae bacterium]|jgi:arginine/lysine/ornithine decarboxylase|nr:aminotransferase class I/II-fold pyridoxal phosphate-dependent enzyme [Heliobacteriaceae bacterium]